MQFDVTLTMLCAMLHALACAASFAMCYVAWYVLCSVQHAMCYVMHAMRCVPCCMRCMRRVALHVVRYDACSVLCCMSCAMLRDVCYSRNAS